MAVASLVPVDSSLFELRQLHHTSVHPYLDVCVFLCSGRILARKQASFVRHERTAARLLCPVHDASRSVVSCACGPVGMQVRRRAVSSLAACGIWQFLGAELPCSLLEVTTRIYSDDRDGSGLLCTCIELATSELQIASVHDEMAVPYSGCDEQKPAS
jgi:hypothetical protein